MKLPKPEELISTANLKKMPSKWWMDIKPEFKRGFYCYGAKGRNLAYVDFPNARDWSPTEPDWKLPEDWKRIVIEGIKQRIERFRTFHIFMDICVRCGACADKCHFFLGSGDPKNMPVLRAELLRSVYRESSEKP